MKITYRCDRMLFELEADSAKEVFEWLAEIQGIFEAEKNCGRCNSANLRLRVRPVEKGKYYELICADCLGTLAFGQTKTGSLFVKRKDGEGNALSHRGWRAAFGKSEELGELEEAGKGAGHF